MRALLLSAFIVAALLAYGCSEQISESDLEAATEAGADDDLAAAKRGPSGTVVVQFGRLNVGSPFPPPDHDRSFHAFDAIRPRTVVIPVGGTVTFEVAPFHYPAIYEPGIEPDDIDTSELHFEPGCPIPIFEDEEGRIAEGPLTCPGSEIVSWSHTFNAPGSYLVICQILPHFVEAKMYSWVVVK